MNSVLIVVLNWNGMADTKACIESISKQTYQNFKVVLVDNNSNERATKQFLDELSKKHSKFLHVIRNHKNSGFAGGVNIGIKYGLDNGFEFIALLNNDATVQSDWLTRLVDAAVSKKSAITTGLLLHETGKTIDSTGDWYSTWGLPFPRDRNYSEAKASESGFVFGGSGGASLYRSSLFHKIGLFDEVFFAYYEDMDMSFRAQLAGEKVYYEKSAVAYHKQGASSISIPDFGVFQALKNLPLLYIRNVPRNLLVGVGIRFFPAYSLITLNALRHASFKTVLRGFFIGLYLFWTHGFASRRLIQRTRVKSKDMQALLWNDLPPEQSGLRKLRALFIRKT